MLYELNEYLSSTFISKITTDVKIATQEIIPYKSNSVVDQTDLINIVFALSIGVILALTILYFLKRYGDKNQLNLNKKKRIQVIETRRLSPKVNLSLITVDNQDYLISATDSNATIILHNGNLAVKEHADEQAK